MLGEETAFIVTTTFFYNCGTGYCVRTEAWAETAKTVLYEAYNTK